MVGFDLYFQKKVAMWDLHVKGKGTHNLYMFRQDTGTE